MCIRDRHKTTAMPARQAERHVRSRICKQPPHLLTIESCTRICRQVHTAQRDQRCDGCVEIQRRGAIEIEVQLLLVLVLWLQHATAARGGYRTTAEHDAQSDASCDRHDPQCYLR